jgi:hypothetical protein
VTIDVGQGLSISENDGSDMQHYHDDATGSSPSNETDTGETDSSLDEHDIISGDGHNNVSLNIQTSDGNGNSVSINESDNDSTTINGHANEDDSTRDDFGDANGQQTSDSETDTEQGDVDIDSSNDDTANEHDSIQITDPVTGLKTTVSFNNNGSTNDLSDHITGDETTKSTSTLSGGSTSGPVSGDSGEDKQDHISQHLKSVVTIQGTDSDGSQVNLSESVTLDDSEDDEVTDNDQQPEGGQGSETIHNHDVTFADIVDKLTGSIAKTDPTTGITTTTTLNDQVSTEENDTADETDGLSSTGPATLAQTDGGTETDSRNIQENVTQTNPDGTPVQTAAATTSTDNGNNATTWQNSLSQSAGAQPTQTINATETGFDSSSDPTIGATSWTNRALDPAVAATRFPAASMLQAGGQNPFPGNPPTGGTGGPGQSPPGSGGDGSQTVAGQQAVWGLQEKVPQLLAEIQNLKQTLAKSDLSDASRRVHQSALAAAQAELQSVKDRLGVQQSQPDPVGAMPLEEKFVGALQIALDKDLFASGIKEKVTELLQPANLAKTIATVGAITAVYAAAHGTPAAPFLVVLDVGFAASAGTETALALHQIYLDLDSATTRVELNLAAGGLADQLTGKVADEILSLLLKAAAKGAAAGAGKASAKTKSAGSGPELPVQGSGGPGKVYLIDGEQLSAGQDYIGKTRQPTVSARMKGADHKSKTVDGSPPAARTLAEDLTIDEMDGVEGLLIDKVGLENLSNKMKGRDFSLEKNKSRLTAGKRVLGQD